MEDTLNRILTDYTKEGLTFKQLLLEYKTGSCVGSFIEKLVYVAMNEHAKERCEAQKFMCADNAKVVVGNLLERNPHNKYFFNMKGNLFVECNKESIINTPNALDYD